MQKTRGLNPHPILAMKKSMLFILSSHDDVKGVENKIFSVFGIHSQQRTKGTHAERYAKPLIGLGLTG